VVELASDRPGETVQLSWPELGASAPGSARLLIEDLETGVKRSMRHTNGLSVQTGNAGPRRFAIVLEPQEGRGAITSMAWQKGRSGGGAGQLSFTLTADMKVDAVVTGIGGTVVRHLLRAEPFAAGAHGVTWDGRDDRGRVVPSGAYRIDLVAINEFGEQVRATRTVDHRR
jgi:hypothetical protein